MLAPPLSHPDSAPPPLAPAASGEVYGSLVNHHQSPPDYGSFRRDGRDDQYYGSGDGDYEYEYDDYYDDEYEDDFYGSEDTAPDAGGDQQYRPQPDRECPAPGPGGGARCRG